MGLSRLMTSFFFIVLFSLAIILYAVGFANDNTVYSRIDENSSEFRDINVLIKQNLSDSNDVTESSIEAIWKSDVSGDSEASKIGGQFKTSPSSIFSTSKVILSSVFTVIFGNDANFKIILTSLLGAVAFILGLYIWKLLKGGSPD